MFETKLPSTLSRVACRYHGVAPDAPDPIAGAAEGTLPWRGDITCLVCLRVWLCEEGDEKRIYPEIPDDGFCACGSALFPNVGAVNPGVFSAQPKCPECAKLVWAQQHPETSSAAT